MSISMFSLKYFVIVLHTIIVENLTYFGQISERTIIQTLPSFTHYEHPNQLNKRYFTNEHHIQIILEPSL